MCRLSLSCVERFGILASWSRHLNKRLPKCSACPSRIRNRSGGRCSPMSRSCASCARKSTRASARSMRDREECPASPISSGKRTGRRPKPGARRSGRPRRSVAWSTGGESGEGHDMSLPKPYHRNWRAVKAGPNSGYSSWDTSLIRSTRSHPFIMRAHKIVQADLERLFEYVEPSPESLQTFSYRIHELLMRACIEVKANFQSYFNRKYLHSSSRSFW